MGRLSSLISLCMLAATAGSLPQRVQAILGRDPGLAAYSNAAATLELAARQAREGRPADAAPFTAEERQLAAEASPQTEVLTTPLMAALVKTSRSTIQMPELDSTRALVTAYSVYEQNQAAFMSVVWAAPATLLVLSSVFLVLGAKGAARGMAELCSSLSSKWLFVLSLAAGGLFAAQKVNLWTSLPQDLWGVPVVALLAAGGMLRMLDLNYPLWNSTVSTLVMPLLSCLFIAGYSRLG